MSNPRFPYGGRRHVAKEPNAVAVEIRGLEVAYPRCEVAALRSVNLTVPRGSRVAFVGPNGAGKSTLLKVLAGLVPVHSGEVRIYGHPIGTCHHRVAYLPQTARIDWSFPICVQQFVLTGRYPHLGWLRRPGVRDRAMVREIMEQFGLGAFAERQIGQLSGGQKQRMLLARALAQEADLLLLDEPTSGVDEESRAVILATITRFATGDRAVVVATHDVTDLEQVYDKLLYLKGGYASAAMSDASSRSRCREALASTPLQTLGERNVR